MGTPCLERWVVGFRGMILHPEGGISGPSYMLYCTSRSTTESWLTYWEGYIHRNLYYIIYIIIYIPN
jgi:hypothetical protein